MQSLESGLFTRIRLVFAASIFVPLAITAYIGWTTYEQQVRVVADRADKILDVVEEQGNKLLLIADQMLRRADLLLGQDDAAIRAAEKQFSSDLADVQAAMPEIQSIWAFDAVGHPLVSSTIFPVPPALDNSDRDYFVNQTKQDSGLYIGRNIKARVGTMTFFVASRRRRSESFSGVVALTIPPDNVLAFYEKVARGSNFSVGLFRSDGTPLARHPVPAGGLYDSRTSGAFLDQLSRAPDGGTYSVVSGVDNTRRTISYRRLQGSSIYATVGYDEAAFWAELRPLLIQHSAVGVPLIALLGIASLIALARSRDLIQELERRKLAEAALKENQRLEALGHLTGSVAHDFNNLLTIVQTNAERVLRTADEPSRRRISNIIAAVERGARLTSQLLTFSRRQSLAPTNLDLRKCVLSMWDMLRATLPESVELELEVKNQLPPVWVDRSELEVAMINLVVNARDAMPSGGKVIVRLQCSQIEDVTKVHVCVADTGVGIRATDLTRIFEPYYTTKAAGQGTGLGLSQVYGFVKQSGGEIFVKSAVGQGTEFRLEFPASTTSELQREMSEAVEPMLSSLRILVVDDNREIAEGTADLLAHKGHQVEFAMSAREAIGKLNDSTFDLVISDIVMPGDMSGVDLAKHVSSFSPMTKVILSTGYASSHASELFPYRVLKKPYSSADLEELLRATFIFAESATSCLGGRAHYEARYSDRQINK